MPDAAWLKDDAGYWAIQAINGVGKTIAAIFVADASPGREGGVSRIGHSHGASSAIGLTPTTVAWSTK